MCPPCLKKKKNSSPSASFALALNCFSEGVSITKYSGEATHLENFKAFDQRSEGLFPDNCLPPPKKTGLSPLGLARRRWPGVWSGRRGCSCGRRTSRSPGPAWPGSPGAAACGSAARPTWRRHSPVDPPHNPPR